MTERGSMAPARLGAAALGGLDRTGFGAVFGGVFEHSPWVAERAFDAGPFPDVESLHGAMTAAMRAAGEAEKLTLIRAHPELAGTAVAKGTLTAESSAEQASAGLTRLTPAELDTWRAMNERYRDTFGFPFIMAVKGRDKTEILDALETRLGNTRAEEFDRALDEIARIARFRLADIVTEDGSDIR